MASILKYRTPHLLLDVITRLVPSPKLDILDLGCGTGLFGAQLYPRARKLTGVDLSPNMLNLARQRKTHDKLVCGELIEFLRTQTGEFDLAVAADVFGYIGDLTEVFHGVRRALRHGGFFCFSVEAGDERDFLLTTSLRYAHSDTYLRELAKNHGLGIEGLESQVLRQDDGMDVVGHIAVLRRA